MAKVVEALNATNAPSIGKCQDLGGASGTAASEADKPIDPEPSVQVNVDSILFLFYLHLDTQSDDLGTRSDISEDVPSDDVPSEDKLSEDVPSEDVPFEDEPSADVPLTSAGDTNPSCLFQVSNPGQQSEAEYSPATETSSPHECNTPLKI